jgi:hypothetical protein
MHHCDSVSAAQEDELRALLEKKPHPVCYDGFEPSGRMHIAQGIMKAINVRVAGKSMGWGGNCTLALVALGYLLQTPVFWGMAMGCPVMVFSRHVSNGWEYLFSLSCV